MRLNEITGFEVHRHAHDGDLSVSGKEVAEHLIQNCRPWFRSAPTPPEIFRGAFSPDPDKLAYTAKPPINRAPKDSSKVMQAVFQDALRQAGAQAHRANSFFATRNLGQAETYGDGVYCIFPVGEFDYTYITGFPDLYNRADLFLTQFLHPSVLRYLPPFDQFRLSGTFADLYELIEEGQEVWDQKSIDGLIQADRNLENLENEELLIANAPCVFVRHWFYTEYVREHL